MPSAGTRNRLPAVAEMRVAHMFIQQALRVLGENLYSDWASAGTGILSFKKKNQRVM